MKNWNALSDENFRQQIRSFFEAHFPKHLTHLSRYPRWADVKEWYLKLSAQGWAAPNWPKEHGGMGLDGGKLLAFVEEQERWLMGRAPYEPGIMMLGPLLIQFGTEEQKRTFLPAILAGEHVWCQGYSEPNAGSDLANLKTEAVLEGDEYVINGSKIWTSFAQDATHMFILVRTEKSAKKQEGISFLLLDMKSPGITLRPIRNILGYENFCQVFLDNVRAPARWLVGKPNQGWTIAKAMLGFERIFLGSPKHPQFALRRLEAVGRALGRFKDPVFADRFAQLRMDVADLVSTYARYADIVKRGELLGPDVSLLKLWATETFQRITEATLEAADDAGGLAGEVSLGDAALDVSSPFYTARPATIYGGSNEIQRNILAKNVLGLPG